MRFFSRAALIAFALLACALAPAAASARGLDAYDVKFENGEQLEQLARQGFDMTEARRGNTVEVVATTKQAKQLRALGLTTKRKTTGGFTPRQRAGRAQRPNGSWDVFRPYFDPAFVGTVNPDGTGGTRPTLYQELQALALANQGHVKAVVIGHTHKNKPILALKVTKDAREVPDGQRPAVLYSATQHAREWLATETNRRMVHLFIDNYGGTGPAEDEDGDAIAGVTQGGHHPDRQQERAVVRAGRQPGRLRLHVHARQPPVAQEPARQQQRRADHADVDGVDPNRNFPTNWELRRGGLLERPRRARPTAAPPRPPSPRRRRSTASRSASTSS